MADTFTWSINNLDRHVADGAVYCSYWSVNAERTLADGEVISAGAYGSVGFGAPDPSDFIPYADLTQEKVLEWTQEALGGDEYVATMEANLSKQLDERETPIHEAGVPW